jgi:hypothetical protein
MMYAKIWTTKTATANRIEVNLKVEALARRRTSLRFSEPLKTL